MAENDESLDMYQSYKYVVSGSETKNTTSIKYTEVDIWLVRTSVPEDPTGETECSTYALSQDNR